LVEQTITDNRVRISVIDYGEGIAEADVPFIWDRYFKSGKAHKRAVTGSGLGLSIVKKIIDIHGAQYGVISEPGKGSTFWFELGLLN
jgi:signal transduction histidine kinase